MAGVETSSHSARRRALGEFLRQARARLDPQAQGLQGSFRRRTPGLRREEVSQLAGISVTWYTWIEQGREVSVSPAVWARLASALKLDRAGRTYLFELAECADPDRGPEDPADVHQPAALQACVDAIHAAAYVLDRCWDIRVFNGALDALFDRWPSTAPAPNLLDYIFLNPAARHLVVDWEERARRVVAEFRADAGAHLDEPDVRAVLTRLSQGSEAFRHWWVMHTVVEREGGRRVFTHPQAGQLHFRQMNFRLATQPDLKLVMLLADAG